MANRCTGGNDLSYTIGGKTKMIGECVSESSLLRVPGSQHLFMRMNITESTYQLFGKQYADPNDKELMDSIPIEERLWYSQLRHELTEQGAQELIDKFAGRVNNAGEYFCITYDNCPISVGHHQNFESAGNTFGTGPYGEHLTPKDDDNWFQNREEFVNFLFMVRSPELKYREESDVGDYTWDPDTWGDDGWNVFNEDSGGANYGGEGNYNEFAPAGGYTPGRRLAASSSKNNNNNDIEAYRASPPDYQWQTPFNRSFPRDPVTGHLIYGGYDQFEKGQWTNFSQKNFPYWNSSWPQEEKIGAFAPGDMKNSEDYFHILHNENNHGDSLNPYHAIYSQEMKYYGGQCSHIQPVGQHLHLKFNEQGSYAHHNNRDAGDLEHNLTRGAKIGKASLGDRQVCCLPADATHRLLRSQTLMKTVTGDGNTIQRLAAGTVGGYSCTEVTNDPYACVRPVHDYAIKGLLMEVSDYCCECHEIKKDWPLIEPEECKDWYGTKMCEKMKSEEADRFICEEEGGEDPKILYRVPYGKRWHKKVAELFPLKISRNTAHMTFKNACCKTCSTS